MRFGGAKRHANSDFLSTLSDAVSRDGVDSNSRNEKAGQGKGREQCSEHTERPSLLAEQVVHGPDVVQRKIGVNVTQFIPDRRDRLVLRQSASRDHSESNRWILPERKINKRLNREIVVRTAPLKNQRADADDRYPRKSRVVGATIVEVRSQPDVFAEWIFARKVFSDECRIDDPDFGAGSAVSRSKVSAARHRQIERTKISWADGNAIDYR